MANALNDVQSSGGSSGSGGGNSMNPVNAPIGYGLARGAADLTSLHKIWTDEYTNGNTNLQFREWLASQGIKNPVMPR